MAILKCKMCGADLEITEDMNLAECEYCGTKQTVPTADSEKKISLFTRANKLRAACDFDKAAGVYESIVTEFPEEAEAYWGLILCRYGIEYVDDPATGKKIPTCHRSSFDSLMNSDDFELVMENADSATRRVYREEAKFIEELRKSIIEVSSKEEPYDIFICYKETDENGDRTIDSVIAQDVYTELTNKGYRVFFSRITLEDKLGQEYEPYIFAALNSAKIMLAFGTDYEYFNAVWVKNEWSRFLQLIAKGEKKTLIPCYKNIDAYDMPKEFAKLQAQDMGKVGALQDLLRGIEKIIGVKQPEKSAETVVVNQVAGGPNVAALLKRGRMALEDKEWEKAKGFFDEVLNMDAECAEAYLGLAMAEFEKSTEKDLMYSVKFNNKNYIRAKQYADKDLLDKLTALEKETEEERIRREKAAEEKLIENREKNRRIKNTVSAGEAYTVGLKSDGTVVAVGSNDSMQCNVFTWKEIVAVSAGGSHTVGLKIDGTVVAMGSNDSMQCNVSVGKDIVDVSAGYSHTVGLKSDGTVIVVGSNGSGQCNVSDWKDIVAVAAGASHTVGLKSDGTVVAVGSNYYEQCNVSEWKNIAAVAAGYSHTIGLKSDGTVVSVGNDYYGQCNVSDWKDIVAVSAGGSHTIGLKTDRTVVAVGNNNHGQCNVSEWKNIVSVAAGGSHTVGLKSDGLVVTIGSKGDGRCNVSDWKLFDDLSNLEQERKIKFEERKRFSEGKQIIEEQIAARRSQGLCQYCGGTFKGLFTKKCSDCGKEKDY